MGNSAIWYWPDIDATSSSELVKIDLGERASDYQLFPERLVVGEDRGLLAPSGVDYGGRFRLRLTLERFSDPDLVTALETLQCHLDKGLSVAVAADEDNAWCTFQRGAIGKVSVFNTTGSLLPHYSTAAPAANDVCYIQSGNPERYVTRGVVASWSSPLLMLDDPIPFPQIVDPVLIHHQDFLPLLYRPIEDRGTPIVTHFRRNTYTLDVDLVEAPELYTYLHQGGAIAPLPPNVSIDRIVDPGLEN